MSRGPLDSPRKPRRLFAADAAGASTATPRLHWSIIPKIVACKRWRPRLAERLLPKYLMAFDPLCVRFVFRCGLHCGGGGGHAQVEGVRVVALPRLLPAAGWSTPKPYWSYCVRTRV